MNVDIALDLLFKALPKIEDVYFATTPCEVDIPERIRQDREKYKKLQEFLTRYGERIFCYELYHQIRCLMDEFYCKNPDATRLVFHGELRKDGLGGLEELYALPSGELPQALDKEYVPDFLLHKPFSFEHQELIVEVKADPKLILGRDVEDGNPLPNQFSMKNDLKKIQEFITRYGYKKGVFLSVNTSVDDIQDHLNTLRETWLGRHIQNPDKIVVICMPESGPSVYEAWLNQPDLTLHQYV